jgi:hypothetical protein
MVNPKKNIEDFKNKFFTSSTAQNTPQFLTCSFSTLIKFQIALLI